MKSEKMCSKCIMPGSTPGIEFDSDGVCNYCRTYAPMPVQGEDELKQVLDAFRGGDGEYDCMVCISGGRDSTYALWKAVHDYGLRVLACNYMNPFTSEQARANMRNALDILGIDCVSWEFPNNAHKRATEKALKAWSFHPSSNMIPIVCAHCKAIWPTLYQVAREKGISLILIGTNPLETASFKESGFGGARSYHKLSNLPRIVAKSIGELALNPRYLVSCSWSTVVKAYLMASHASPYLRRRYNDIAVVRLFDYLKWNEKQVMDTIRDNLGWRESAEVASPWRFDCRLDYVRRLMYSATIGVTELRDLFSKMIREGQMTRDEALKRLETEDVIPRDVAEDVLAGVGLRLSDLELGY